MRAVGRLAVTAVVGACLLTGCTSSSAKGVTKAVTKVKAGDCILPEKLSTEVSKLTVVSCAKPHTQEAYATPEYAFTSGDPYPGPLLLKNFADGKCAEDFEPYVGISYAVSSLFFTYLLPSARGWEASDRTVTCFVTTTGPALNHSVRHSKL